MLLSSLTRRFVPLAKPSNVAMLCSVVSHRLPCAAAATARRAAVAPFPAPCLVPTRSLLARAQKEPTQPQPESGNQQQQPGGGSQLQPRSSQQGGELSSMPFGGDLMELRTMMPTPFRRMADHMLQMQREMDSLMGAFGMASPLAMTDPFDIFDRAAAAPLVARRAGALGRPVALDVSADEQGYTVTAEVPGFDKSEIKVSLSEDGFLTMSGSHEEASTMGGDKEAKEGGDKAGEGLARGGSRRFASFVRSIQLPDDADVGGISATTQHGVLTVRIPKAEKPAPKVREIPVA
ncbi:hypothetical protein PLESTB_000191700 [Pleodorina starrii]|uniref:SHSP domain-containing protein n=1 Tax=Pleodorina starrii TaxID=330485 RepID=A0A9W6EYL1_9CHLO|nr:hypothetical protein PLESTB_000191700 [Pleodorina starrii]GLC73557.1 hypothetical protein PLESTF_001391000 [Pleodorina starrii]